MTSIVPGPRPGLAAAERAGLEQALARAQQRIDGLHRSAREIEDRLRDAGDPADDPVAIRALARRHGELLGRIADAIAQRDALDRYLERLDGDAGRTARPDPSSP